MVSGGIKEAASPKEGGSHRDDLDGLRGLAIGLVLIEHLIQSIIGPRIAVAPGPTGLTVFFVLSGYLITTLLVREKPIGLRRFYARRVIRLAPALILLLVFVVTVGIVRGMDWIPGVAGALTYSTNLFPAARGSPLIGQTWSLAIEEQFYLLWPLTMILVPRRCLLWVALVGAVASVVTYGGSDYHSTLANGGSILAGCALAVSGWRAPRIVGLVGLALIVTDVFFWQQWPAVVGSVLVMAGPIRALVPLAPVGRRAYGLYLWNTPMLVLLGPPGIFAAVAVAGGSYRYLEQPILRRYHDRFRSEAGPRSRCPEVPVEHARSNLRDLDQLVGPVRPIGVAND